ncbi:hypothetical protein FDP41_005750 [Naegleria fowleri]|uniref:Major facilitator superfamily (MFS) profile domain-containing protein n=1 Tax=Naegleria fowleri TaxID=5763 RepID=A0A6A5BD56_NAEFO|nr:uncharacterized protein FDP41_005750 [Naegleria fowleri]KAF0974997.1 hypothetical protein FDP41_005750 [Naegleria fowleri]
MTVHHHSPSSLSSSSGGSSQQPSATLPIVTVTTSTQIIPKHRTSPLLVSTTSSLDGGASSSTISPIGEQHHHASTSSSVHHTIHESPSPSSFFFVLCFCYSFFCSGLAISMIGPLLPSFVYQINMSLYREGEKANVSLEDLGVLFPSRGLGTMLGSLLGGFLINYTTKTWSRQQHVLPLVFTLIGAILMFIAEVIVLIAAQPRVFAIVYFVVGFSHGLINVSSSSHILNKFPKEKVTFYLQLLNATFGLGAVFGPFICALTKKYYSKSISTNVLAVAILSESSTTKAILVLLFLIFVSIVMYIIEIRRTKPISLTSHQKESTGVSSMSWRSIKIILLVCLGIICVTGCEHGVGGTLYSYIHTKRLTTESEASLINSSFWLSFTVGRILSIFLSYHMKSSSILTMDVVGSLLSSIVFLIFSSNVPSIWVATIILGLSLSSQYPTLLSFPSSHLDVKVSSIVTSLFIVCGGVGSMVLPYVMISLFKSNGPESMFYVLLVTFLCVAFVYSYLILGFKKKHIDPYITGIIGGEMNIENDLMSEEKKLKRRK